MMVGDQSEVLNFLTAPDSYPGRPPVERIDTHASTVFLAGERAYKLKRAVRYDYLDYSTVERRSAACEAELRLNRRTAPTLYVDAMPLTRDAGGALRFAGTGPAVDWVVVMRRFDQDRLLDRMATAGTLTLDTIVRMADIVATFHERAEPRRDAAGADAMSAVVEGNAAALTAARGILDQHIVTRLNQTLRTLVAWHAESLDGRRARGMVRECHGDLHLRNIVLLDGTPTLFDGIEFNEGFSCIDVMYDFAFLVMDLLGRELPMHAHALFNRYLMRTGDFDGLRLFPLFLACRAAIRAKTSLAAADLASDRAAAADLRRRAAAYLDLADRVSRPAPPRLIAIGGFSGTGKSTLAARIAPALGAAPGAVVLRTDVVRKTIFAHGQSQPLPAWAYSRAARHTVYTEARREAACAIDAGYVAIVDAVFGEEPERRAIEDLAARAGVTFDGLWLEANVDVLEQRIRQRRGDASEATVDVLLRQMREGLTRTTWQRIDASGDAEWTAREARRALDHEIPV